MTAVSCRQGELSVVDLPTPEPESGQVLLDVRRCGICGSDLHDRGRGVGRELAVGTPVVSMPLLRRGGAARPLGLSPQTGSDPRWRSTRSSTCGSCSAARRWSSATRCTGSPRAVSTPRPMVTGTVGLEGVAGAFDALADPSGAHAKVLIDPTSSTSLA